MNQGEDGSVNAVNSQSGERGEVEREDREGHDAHRVPTPPSGPAAPVIAQLSGAGAVAGLSYWLAAYQTAGPGADLAAVVLSPLFAGGIAAAFAASLWAARLFEFGASRRPGVSLSIIVGAAVLFRAILLPAAPILSDDVYRYVWDGLVQARGLNPYRHAPSDPALDSLDTGIRARVNNPDLPTIYPPVTQAVFLATALAGGGVLAAKSIMILFDVGTILVLAAILKRRGLNPARVVIYAWSPLAVIEVGWSGHNDPIGVFLLMLGALALAAGRPRLSAAAAALSGAAKYAGLLALPAVARRARWWAAVIVPAALAAAYAPYLSAGWGVFGSLPAYAERWRFNDAAFSGILAGVERAGLAGLVRGGLISAGALDPGARWETSLALRLTEPLSLAKGLAAAAFVLFAVRTLRRRWDDPVREIFALVGAALLLSPTLHPWYLLWIAPFLAILPRLSWTWLTFGALVFSYPMMALKAAGADPPLWLALAEYVPFFTLLAVESARRRLWERA